MGAWFLLFLVSFLKLPLQVISKLILAIKTTYLSSVSFSFSLRTCTLIQVALAKTPKETQIYYLNLTQA